SPFPFLGATPPTAISPLSLHDALPISRCFRVLSESDGRMPPPHDPLRPPPPLPLAHGELNESDAAELRALKSQIQRRVGFVCERSEEHTSELQSRENLVCRLLLEKKNN